MCASLVRNRYRTTQLIENTEKRKVYSAFDKFNNNEKVLIHSIDITGMEQTYLDSILKRLEIIKSSRHPNLKRIHDFHINKPTSELIISMNHYDQQARTTSFIKKLNNDTQKLNVLTALIRTLDFMHNKRLCHGYLKPDSIILEKGIPAIIDLPLTFLYNQNGNAVNFDSNYLTPDSFRNNITDKTDIFSLGIIIFEIVLGESFYADKNPDEIEALLQDETAYNEYAVSRVNAITDPCYNMVLGQCLCYNPVDRYNTPLDIIEILNKYDHNVPYETDETIKAYIEDAVFPEHFMVVEPIIEMMHKTDAQAYYIFGEKGAGKSHISQTITKYAARHNFSVVSGSFNKELKRFFNPFISILTKLLDQANPELVTTFGPHLKKILKSHPALANIQVAKKQDTRIERTLITKRLVEFLVQASGKKEHGIIFLIDNVQWADENGREIIRHLINRISTQRADKLKLLLFGREEGLELFSDQFKTKDTISHFSCIEHENKNFVIEKKAKSQAKQSSVTTPDSVHKVRLTPINTSRIKRYLYEFFGEKCVGTELIEQIKFLESYSRGNSYLLFLALSDLLLTKRLIRKPSKWVFAENGDLTTMDLPEDIKEGVNRWLNGFKLDDKELRALEIICLLDRNLTYDDLIRVFEIEFEAIVKFEQLRILKKEYNENIAYFYLYNNIIREVILENTRNISELHNFIALRIERTFKKDIEDYYEELSFHYSMSDNQIKAVYYLEKAGLKAREFYENEQAISYFKKLLMFIDPENLLKRFDALLNLGDIYRNIASWNKCEKKYIEACKLIKTSSDSRRKGDVYFRLGRLYTSKFEPVKSIEAYEKAIEYYKVVDYTGGVSRCYNYIGINYSYFFNEYDKASYYHETSIDLARKIRDNVGLALNFGNLGLLSYIKGNYDKAVEYFLKSLEIMEKRENLYEITVCMNYLGVCNGKRGNNELGLYYFDRAMTIAEDIESKELLGILHIERAIVLTELEKYKLAQDSLDRGLHFTAITDELDYHFNGKLLSCRLDYLQDKQEEAVCKLQKMLNEELENAKIADIYYELWKIELVEEYKEKALRLYKNLYISAQKAVYKNRIEELSTYEKVEVATQAEEIANTDKKKDSLTYYKEIESELDEITSIFKENTFHLQVNLKETNEIISRKLNKINQSIEIFEKKFQDPAQFKQKKERIGYFFQILQIIHDLNSNLTLPVLLQKVLDASISLLEADRGIIMLFDKTGKLNIMNARNNNLQNLSEDDYRYSQTVISRVLDKGSAVFVPDISVDAELSNADSILDLDLRSVMCVPLGKKYFNKAFERRKYPFLTSRQLLGVIYLDKKGKESSESFSDENLDFFQGLADEASIALLNAILYEKTNIDPLTGLYLRSFFEESLEYELKYCAEIRSHLAVLMIDVDFFKLINDRYGHQVGDEVLVELAEIFKMSLRATDICGRYGGEEFIIILPNTDIEQAKIVINKIFTNIANKVFRCGKVTVSIGISAFPFHMDDYEQETTARKIIKYADQALYVAKDNGRNRYVIWDESIKTNRESHTSITDILTGNPIRDYRNVQMLLEIIKLVYVNKDTHDILKNILDLILHHIDADRGMIMLYNEKIKALEIKICLDKNNETCDIDQIRYSGSIVTDVFENGTRICQNNMTDDLESTSIMELELKSIMCVPLIIGEERVGVMYIDSRTELREFTKPELSFFNAIAVQVSMIIERSEANESGGNKS